VNPTAVLWLVGIWLLLWGSISPLAIVSGLVVASVLLLATPQPSVEIGLRFRPLRVASLLGFATVDLVLASFRVSWQVLRSRPPRSAIFEVPVRVHGGLLITMLAVGVSAVPGSTVLDVRPQRRLLEIHVLDASGPDAEQNLVRDVHKLERRIAAAFGSAAERARVREGDGR
jgi:multicomponent Na+:H+ antiporter subunit E